MKPTCQALTIQNRLDNVQRSDPNEIAGHRCVKEHAHEVLVIKKADAIGDPGAMMVHLQDALPADAAVVCPRRPQLVTLAAYFGNNCRGRTKKKDRWINKLMGGE